jgi:hypothetical protein
MEQYKLVTISGYNEYIDRLRDEKKFSMLLTLFNSASIEIGEPEPIKDPTKLTNETYNPDNLTPLYDGVAATIKKAEKVADGHAIQFCMSLDAIQDP